MNFLFRILSLISFAFANTSFAQGINASLTDSCYSVAASGTASYSITPVTGATYNWVLPSGMSVLSGQGTNAITASWPASVIHLGVIGDLCVTIDSAGTVSTLCVAIDFNRLAPVTPGSVNGLSKACPYDTIVYLVAPVSRASYFLWTLPSGVHFVDTSYTNIVTVTFDTTFTGGMLEVQAGNVCGISSPRQKNIGLNYPPVPVIGGLANGVCGQTGIIYNCIPSSITKSYHWTAPVGATIVSSNSDTTLILDFTSSFSNGYLTCYGINFCGSGLIDSFFVAGYPEVPGVVTGPITVCANTGYNYAVGMLYGATQYNWTSPGVITGQGNNQITVTYGPTPASGQQITVSSQNACGMSGLRILSGIAIMLCSGVDEIKDLSRVKIFPLPVNDFLKIEINNPMIKEYILQLIDETGRVVYNTSVINTKNDFYLPVQNIRSGFYTLLLQTENNLLQKRIVIE